MGLNQQSVRDGLGSSRFSLPVNDPEFGSDAEADFVSCGKPFAIRANNKQKAGNSKSEA